MEKNMRNIIIALDKKFNHKWNNVYEAISKKTNIDDDELSEILNGFDTSSVITILDSDYPSALKFIQYPPFIIYREDIDKINAFVKAYEDIECDGSLGNKPINEALIIVATEELEASIKELKDNFGKLTNAIQLLNEIRRDDI